jgi:chromosome segregation ATPase
LAALAVEIRTSKAGHFDKVIESIDKMLKTLQEEGADDLAKKTQCDDEYQEITKTVNKLDWKIKNNKAQIAKLEGLIELRTKEKEETIQKIKETIEYMDEAKKERKAENDAFLQAKKDDETAIGLLEDAKAAFAKFGKENLSLLTEPEFASSNRPIAVSSSFLACKKASFSAFLSFFASSM